MSQGQPAISIIILNYNGVKWLDRCLRSIETQTIFDRLEIIISDNASTDASEEISKTFFTRWGRGRFLNNGSNLGYCGGNNRGADAATGKWLLFLNNDTWLEPDCMEQLLDGAERAGAGAASSYIMDYDDDHFQFYGGDGIDLFGYPCAYGAVGAPAQIFCGCGAALFVRADLFRKIGKFDEALFIYADETCVSWRVWIAGETIVAVPSSRLHHRGGAVVNPSGDTKVVEVRTSETKRFLTNRNSLLLVAKNSQHLFLLLLVPQLCWLAAEALALLVLTRRWSVVRAGYVNAVLDCFRLRGHVRTFRRQVAAFRQRGDFWMLRFLRLKIARWGDVSQVFKRGAPIIDKK